MSNDRSSLCVPDRSSLYVHPLPPLFTRLSKQLRAALAATSVAAVVLVVQLSQIDGGHKCAFATILASCREKLSRGFRRRKERHNGQRRQGGMKTLVEKSLGGAESSESLAAREVYSPRSSANLPV